MKILLSLFIMTTLVFGLNTKQIKTTQTVYNVGKTIKASNGETFEKALSSMMAQESSWGTLTVGDKYDSNGRLKSLYDSSLGILQVKLSTAKLTIKKYKTLNTKYKHLLNTGKSTYKEYAKHNKLVKKYQKIVDSPSWNSRYKKGDKKAKQTLNWAKRELKKQKKLLLVNKKQAQKDTMLINALMNNPKICAEIGGHYLLSMYEEAIKRGYKNPYKRAIGRYNGGWHNVGYYKKVKKRMKTLNKLIKKGVIH